MLASNKVRVLVDVRRFPRSKTEHFNKKNLRVLLATTSISYEWMGETLGGFREGGYERHMQTEIFRRGLEDLIKLASKTRVCVMCLEISPRGCHRRFIARALRGRGVGVLHILSRDRVTSRISVSKRSPSTMKISSRSAST